MSSSETCTACKGRGYHNVRGSGPAARRGGWKRRSCACVSSTAKPPAARPRSDVATPPWDDVVRKAVADKIEAGVRIVTVDSIHGAVGGSRVRTRAALDRMVDGGLLEKTWTVYDEDGSSVWGGSEAPHLPSIVREHSASTGASSEPDDYRGATYYESTAPRVSDYDRGRRDVVGLVAAEARRLAAAADEVSDPQAAMLYEDFARWAETLSAVAAQLGGRPGAEV